MLLEAATVRIDTWPNVAKEDLAIPTSKEAKELSILLERHRKEKAVEVGPYTTEITFNMHMHPLISKSHCLCLWGDRLLCLPSVQDRVSTLC